jgi:hypothetical protein
MTVQRYIVAEVSKNWPEEQPRLLAELFEEIINTNWHRGYRLHSWKLHRFTPPPTATAEGIVQLNETIVAVFEQIAKA